MENIQFIINNYHLTDHVQSSPLLVTGTFQLPVYRNDPARCETTVFRQCLKRRTISISCYSGIIAYYNNLFVNMHILRPTNQEKKKIIKILRFS